MATASAEIGGVDLKNNGSSIHGPCQYQESLTVSATQATQSVAVTAAQVTAAGGVLVGRLATDTDCFWAVGATPDATATTKTSATTAKRLLSAGSSIEVTVSAGDKFAVKATS
jgi:hypothetical protein